MKFQRLILLLIIALSATPAVAQHSDIDFSYEDGAIVMRDGVEGFTDGFQVFEGTFPERGFSERFTENPGFLSELANGDMLAAFDDIQIELLQSNTFGTYLTYYDPIADAMMPTDATLNIEDNMGDNTTDILLSKLGIIHSLSRRPAVQLRFIRILISSCQKKQNLEHTDSCFV